ncbi:hypothetical protein F443_07655, partial [Phytophthora nicotianae P1569]
CGVAAVAVDRSPSFVWWNVTTVPSPSSSAASERSSSMYSSPRAPVLVQQHHQRQRIVTHQLQAATHTLLTRQDSAASMDTGMASSGTGTFLYVLPPKKRLYPSVTSPHSLSFGILGWEEHVWVHALLNDLSVSLVERRPAHTGPPR